MQDRPKGGPGGLSLKGRTARCHLAECRAEGEEIRAPIQRLARNLLGRHVSHRTHGAASGRQVPDVECGVIRTRSGLCLYLTWIDFRKTEIEHLGVAAFRHQNVSRLDIPMNNTGSV